MTYLDYLEKKVLLERLVIGLEEPVLVKGLGELQAKIDSGNGGYNVIHGTDFHQQGNQLTFTTNDKFNHETKMTATVIDTIDVNMGGGNIEKRPVIELDIKFANEDYKKIPFSVSDRSTNTHPILISKGFVEKELEALIDVGATNISQDGIDVVYGESVMLDEGVLGTIGKGIAGTAKGVGKGIWGATKLVGKGIAGTAKTATGGNGFLNKVSNFGKWLSGDAKADSQFSKEKISKKDQGMAGKIANASQIEEEDMGTIRNKSSALTFPKKVLKDQQVDTSNNYLQELTKGKVKTSDLPCCLVTSFMMCKGHAKDKNEIKGLDADRDQIKKWVTSTKEKVAKEKENRNSNGQTKEEQEEEVIFSLSESGGASAAYMQMAKQNEEQRNQQEQQQQQEGTPEQQPQDNTEGQPQQQEDDFEETTTFFEQLCNFTLWFVSFEKAKKTKYEKEFKKYIGSGKFDSILYKMFKSGTISPSTVEPFVKQMAQIFQKDGKQGIFALCWTPQSQSELKDEYKEQKRETFFFEDLQYVAYQKKSKSPQFDDAELQLIPDKNKDQNEDGEGEDAAPAGDGEPDVVDTETQTEGEEPTTEQEPTQEQPAPKPEETTPTSEQPKTEGDSRTPKFDEEERRITQLTDEVHQVKEGEPDVRTEEQPSPTTPEEPTPEPEVETPAKEETTDNEVPQPKAEVTEKSPKRTPQDTPKKKELTSQEVQNRINKRRGWSNLAKQGVKKPTHMKKGKKRGTESEEEPWWDDCDDEWIRSKMQSFRDKGIV